MSSARVVTRGRPLLLVLAATTIVTVIVRGFSPTSRPAPARRLRQAQS